MATKKTIKGKAAAKKVAVKKVAVKKVAVKKAAVKKAAVKKVAKRSGKAVKANLQGPNTLLNCVLAFWFAKTAFTNPDLASFRGWVTGGQNPGIHGANIDQAALRLLFGRYPGPDSSDLLQAGDPHPFQTYLAVAQQLLAPPNPWDPHDGGFAVLDAISKI